MSSDGNGRLTFLLRPQKNVKGSYHMGRSNWKGHVDFTTKVLFAYPQPDGSLLISIEEYNESSTVQYKKPAAY